MNILDADHYPTEEALLRIENWPADDFPALMEYIREGWSYYGSWRTEGLKYTLATGGWSGNEEIIGSLMVNKSFFWSLCWQMSERGGLYVFELPVNGPTE